VGDADAGGTEGSAWERPGGSEQPVRARSTATTDAARTSVLMEGLPSLGLFASTLDAVTG